MLQYSPKIVQDGLVMCLDASNNKSYPAADLPLKDQLNLWLDAADDTTFSYSSGTTVSQWRDKSGRNNHAIVMAGSPLRSVAINSRKAVSFTSTSWFKCTTGTFASNATHFLVCRATTSSATYQRVYNGGNDGYLFFGALANNIATFWGTLSSGWIDTNVNSPSITILNTLRIISAINNGSTGTPYYDGTAMSTKTTTNSFAYTGYELNSYSNGILSQPLIGEVCEIIVFNKQLSATELKQVHTYLGQKWGISNTDRSIIDLSGFNDNGLLGDGTTANMPVYDYYNKGAFRFDGSNDFIKIGPNSSLQVNNVTIAAFFKTVNNGQSVQFIAGYGDTGVAGYWIGTSGGPIRFSIGDGLGNYLQQSSGVTPNNDQVYYVVGTYDGTNQRVYVDGVLQASATTVTGNISYTGLTDGFLVGQVQGFTAGRYLTGNVYNISVYNRALSQSEITQNYEALKSKFANTIVQQGLILNLDAGNPYSYAGAGTTWYDVSGNAINASASGTSSYINLYGGLLSFPNNNSYYNTSAVSTFNLGASSFSMECWVYLDATTASDNAYRGIISLGLSSTNYVYIAKWRSGLYSGLYVQYIAAGSTVTGVYQANDYNPVSRWTHVVATKSSNVLYFYVNGVLYSTASDLNTTFNGNSSVYIAQAHGGVNSLYGYVGESRVYNISLSAAQVLQNYNATKGRFGL